eukprot:990627-Rhodomonas_salina.1
MSISLVAQNMLGTVKQQIYLQRQYQSQILSGQGTGPILTAPSQLSTLFWYNQLVTIHEFATSATTDGRRVQRST